MLKSSFSLEVQQRLIWTWETLVPFPVLSGSRPWGWVCESAPFAHPGYQRREVPLLWLEQPWLEGRNHFIVLSPAFAPPIIGHLRGEGNYWVYFQSLELKHLHSLEFRKDFFSLCSKLHGACVCTCIVDAFTSVLSQLCKIQTADASHLILSLCAHAV